MIFFTIIGILVIFFGFVVFFGAPYVPSTKKYIRRAFDHFKIDASDTIVDVGSGDGVVLRVAREYGASAVGYEINPLLVYISRLLSLRQKKIKVLMANFWLVELPRDTTYVYAFTVSRDVKRLARKLQREADRLQKPLKLLIYGSPLKAIEADAAFEAYSLYSFHPLHPEKAQV